MPVAPEDFPSEVDRALYMFTIRSHSELHRICGQLRDISPYVYLLESVCFARTSRFPAWTTLSEYPETPESIFPACHHLHETPPSRH